VEKRLLGMGNPILIFVNGLENFGDGLDAVHLLGVPGNRSRTQNGISSVENWRMRKLSSNSKLVPYALRIASFSSFCFGKSSFDILVSRL
jgi:hypothetical protein